MRPWMPCRTYPRLFPAFGAAIALALGSPLLTGQAQAAGPNQPVDISAVQVASNELGGTLVLPDGSAILTIETRYSECSPGGQCGDKPTLMEVTIGQVTRLCQGLNGCSASWQPGGRRQSFQRDVSVWRAGFIRETSPTLASLGLANLAADSWLGVSVRLQNPAGWSQPFAASIRVAPALDSRDTVPTNISPPELGSYGQSGSRDLVVGSWIDVWNVGRWAAGAVSPATSIKVQVARCPDAACRLAAAQYEASGLTTVCTIANRDLSSTDNSCRPSPWTTITAADACWRGRTQAQNRKGWSAWVESAVKCLPAANAGANAGGNAAGGACLACGAGGNAIDLGAIAPLKPNLGAVDLVQPTPARLPTFTADSNPASPIAAQGALTSGTSYGAVGTSWRLPNGWRAPDLLANTTFTLFGCTSTDKATCTAAGTWPASRLIGLAPALNSTGPLAVATAYARMAQTTAMLDRNGARVTKTALSDWVSVSPAAAAPADGGGNSAAQGDQSGGQSDGSGSGSGTSSESATPDTPAAVDIPPALVAAGVDGRITPLVGTNGEGTHQGITLKVKVPTVETRGERVKAVATVTPRTKGKVWFTFTRTGPNGKVAVGKTRKVTVRATKATSNWTFAQSKPTGTYLLIVRFVPGKKGATGAMVTKAILVK